MLPMGHCQLLPTLCPLQAEAVVVGSQQGLPCGSIGTITTGQQPVVDSLMASPHSIQILPPHRQGLSTYEVILSDHHQQSTVLCGCGLPRSPRGPAWHQSFSGSMPPEDAVGGSKSQTHSTSKSTLPHAVMGKGKHSMPNTYRVARGMFRPSSENWEKLCNCWFDCWLPQGEGKFGEMTT